MAYWEGTPEQWHYTQVVQDLKRDYIGLSGRDAIRSDQYVMHNPVTGRAVPIEDLKYASNPRNLQRLYTSGAIREDRWAFLWYH